MASSDSFIDMSILDTDLYKLTMQQAVLEHYPNSVVSYRFYNRDKGRKFSCKCFELVQAGLKRFDEMALTQDEHDWLRQACPYFKPAYLDYLHRFRFKPEEQVTLSFVETESDGSGDIQIDIRGLWVETILYEVPLMSLVSESCFTINDTQWDLVGQRGLSVILEQARAKGEQLIRAGCVFSEFGTRRRRTRRAHDIVMRGLVDADDALRGEKGALQGTSNVYFAYKYKIKPIGTIAHEWIMGTAAKEGYDHANETSLAKWDQTYPGGELTVALTDTFSTRVFFEDFVRDRDRAQRWRGLRQDSGDPFAFIPVAKRVYESLSIEPKTKTIVFSDGLDVAKCVALKKACDEKGIGCGFGVGTHFTNDFRKVAQPDTSSDGSGSPREGEKSKALNIVIKLYKIDDEFCVKISDELTKNVGDADTVKKIKARFGLEG